jgi:hypothetical protein
MRQRVESCSTFTHRDFDKPASVADQSSPQSISRISAGSRTPTTLVALRFRGYGSLARIIHDAGNS